MGSGGFMSEDGLSRVDEAGIWLAEKDSGMTLREIGERHEVSPSTVQKWVNLEMVRLERPNTEKMRVEVVRKYARVEKLADDLMNLRVDADPEIEQVNQAKRIRGAELMLKVEEGRRKMYGLDSAVKTELTVNPYGGKSREQLTKLIGVKLPAGVQKKFLKQVEELPDVEDLPKVETDG